MSMTIDPKTRKVTHSNPEEVERVGKRFAKAFVKSLNKHVLEEDAAVKKAIAKNKTTQ